MSRRAAVYVRQSISNSEGIDRQLIRCQALIDARGWQLTEIYTDNDVSASKVRGEGTAWARMLADAHRGAFDVVVAVDLDRLLRQVRDLTALIDTGAKVLTVDGEVDLTTADGEFRATMLAGIARFEVRRKSERHRRANDARAAKGFPNGRARTFGFEDGNLLPFEPEASLIRTGVQTILDGGSVRSIAAAWNVAGSTTVRGNVWRNVEVRATLMRERNAGILMVKGVEQEQSQIQPIVPREEWEAMRAILTDPKRLIAGRPTGQRWLSGVMECTCGAPLHVSTSWSQGKGQPGYACSAIKRAETTGVQRRGRHGQIAAYYVEDAIPARVIGALLADAVRDKHNAAPESADVVRLRNVLSGIENERRGVQEMYLIPGADRAHLAARITALGDEHESASEELTRALASRSASDLIASIQAVFADVMENDDADPEHDTMDAAFEVWESLPLEAKRKVTAAKLRIVVQPGGKGVGHGMKRVTVIPR
ncbi:recombinase family protein [Microbacterium sp. A94]|uniref:recombinase family protein n=1 Tax=Microbacterium sp. A94 TaxID=3450717 RepID=UPI003F423ABE